MPDWLHQDEFDRLSDLDNKPIVTPYTRETYVLLGDWFGGGKYLDLLYHLISAGLVEKKGKVNGEIYYRVIK